ncbi:polysaccharide deacetylase family protein [Carnobacteriaceae bacterium zg-ZUI252]|nr:polysaccharide deacetylase family protein [Carnobacteriaceae bacterium zg-ZUI252]QTU83164.1 polysaccharide deacetylase family protein [Carnobacteriaceae bacterium zg-C25]
MRKIVENKWARFSLIGLVVLLVGVFMLFIYKSMQPNAYKQLLDDSLKIVQEKDEKVAYETSKENGHDIVLYVPVNDQNQPNKSVYDRLETMKKSVEQQTAMKDTVHILYALKDASLPNVEAYQCYTDTYRFYDGKYHKEVSVHDNTLLIQNNIELSLYQLLSSAKFDSKSFVESLKQAVRQSSLNADQKSKLENMVTGDTLNKLWFAYSPSRIAMKFTVDKEGDFYIPLNPELVVPYFNTAYIYDNYKEQFKNQIAAALEQQLTKEQEHSKNLSAEMGKKNVGKKIAITFDDGPLDGRTNRVLDILKKYDVKATFYLVGGHVAGNEHLIKRQVAEGHELGNHTWSHPNLAECSEESVMREIQDTQNAVYQAAGVKPKTLRVPYGSYNARVAEVAQLPLVNWSVDSLDWKNRNVQKNIDIVLRNTEPGDIILMHDIHEESVQAVETIVSTLKSKGYEFVTVSELIGQEYLRPNMIYFSATDSRSTAE